MQATQKMRTKSSTKNIEQNSKYQDCIAMFMVLWGMSETYQLSI